MSEATAPPETTAVHEAATRGSWWHRHAAIVAGIAVTLATTLPLWLLSARQWAIYRAPSWDLGIFTQTIRAYAELRAPIVPIKGSDYLILGDHFHPLLVVLAPVYAAFPSGFTLLAAQAVLFGIAAGIVAFVAVRRLGVWGVAIGLASGLSYLIVEAQASQFHEIALALPLVAMSMAMLVQRRGVAACLWALPLLGVKEDLGLTVAAIGIVAALRAGSSRERTWGWATAGVGLAGFVIITQWVLPALNPDGVWAYADDSIVSLIMTDPGAALDRLTSGMNSKLLMVALPIILSGVISVRSPGAGRRADDRVAIRLRRPVPLGHEFPLRRDPRPDHVPRPGRCDRGAARRGQPWRGQPWRSPPLAGTGDGQFRAGTRGDPDPAVRAVATHLPHHDPGAGTRERPRGGGRTHRRR